VSVVAGTDETPSPKATRDDDGGWRQVPVDVRGDAALAARHDLLTHRDHVIGLEAEAAALQQNVDRLTRQNDAQKARIEDLRARLDKQRRRADKLQRELDEQRDHQGGGAASAARRLLPKRER
jgi:hypothetical protein